VTALRDRTNETVIFGARQGERVIYLAVVEGRQTIRYISQAGALKPMHASAVGKALLMAMPLPERTKLVLRLALAATTSRTITSTDALLADIEAAASRGYAQTEGENVADVMAIALPGADRGCELRRRYRRADWPGRRPRDRVCPRDPRGDRRDPVTRHRLGT